MTWVVSLLIGVLVILVITAVTGYFVAQEFAYMAVDRSRLAARAEAGDAAATRALNITRRTSFMLSGAQLGITITGLLVGYVAEPLVGQALGDALDRVSVPARSGWASVRCWRSSSRPWWMLFGDCSEDLASRPGGCGWRAPPPPTSPPWAG